MSKLPDPFANHDDDNGLSEGARRFIELCGDPLSETSPGALTDQLARILSNHSNGDPRQ